MNGSAPTSGPGSGQDQAPIRVALVDDHSMVTQALSSVLQDEAGVEVAKTGASAADALEILRAAEVDVLVLDYNLPDGGALRVLEEARAAELATPVLVLTMHENPQYAVRVLEAGAQGFLVKSSAVDELVAGIRTVHGGEVYLTPTLAGTVVDRLRKSRGERTGLDGLSPREFELLRLLAGGLGLKQAAGTLDISVSTASTYRARLLEKLGLETTSELIRFALENGLVE